MGKKKTLTKLEEAIRELYYDITSEADYYIGHYSYHFIWAGVNKGWNVYIENMTRKDIDTIHWQEVSPYEHFKTKEELITKFKIKEDGRSFLDYICDEHNEQRLLIPPTFEELQGRLET